MQKRRLILGLAVVAAVLVLELAALGTVQAQQAQDGGGMPATLQVPMPREGDQVRYTYDLVPGPGSDTSRRATVVLPDGSRESNANYLPNAPETPMPFLEFRMLPAATARLADDSTWPVYRVHALQFGVDLEGNSVAGFDAVAEVRADARHVVRESLSRVTTEDRDGRTYIVNETESFEVPPPEPVYGCRGTHCGGHGTSAFAGYDAHPRINACLAINTAQGRDLATHRALQLYPGCQDIWMGVFWDPSRGLSGGFGATGQPGLDALYAPVRTESVDGIQAVVYEAVWNGQAQEIWLSPQVPYPLRVVVDLHRDDIPGGDFVLTLRLETYVPGTKPLPDGSDASAFPPAPAGLAWAERQPWGLDEAGLAGSFPASAAWQYLQDNEPDADGGVAVAAHFAERRTNGTAGNSTSRRWDFLLTDGETLRQAFVVQEVVVQAAPADPPLPLPVPVPVPPPLPPPAPSQPTTTTRYQSRVDATSGGPDRPLPADLPARLPTAASVLAAYQQRSGADDGNAWGFDIQLSPQGTRNGEPIPRIVLASWEAGIDLEVQEAGEAPVHTFRMLAFEDGGRTLRYGQVTAVEGPGPDGNGIAGPLVPAAASVAWIAPSVPAVAGASVLALAAGAAVAWLGKGAKGAGALLLFSRVQDAEVAHPNRRALLDLVTANPGIHFNELQRRSGLGQSSTLHHLRKLVAAGHVREVRGKGYTCYVPAGMAARGVAATAPVLRAPGARRLLAAALSHPGTPQNQLARLAGLQPSTASYHVHRLAEAGLVSTADGTVRPTALGETARQAGVASA
jgi:DNA-binding MarR family transcriptional regulator